MIMQFTSSVFQHFQKLVAIRKLDCQSQVSTWKGLIFHHWKVIRGSHMAKYIRQPDWNEFVEFQKAAHNGIRLITVAPELNGAISFIRKCSESGVVVSLGHHNGSTEEIEAAVDAGATLSTHLGNGCANLIDRHKNPTLATIGR